MLTRHLSLLFAFIVAASISLTLTTCGPANAQDADAGEDAVTTIFFSRHAEKAGGKDPELLPAGTARAERLARKLPAKRVAAVYATSYRRTQATAAPTAKTAGVNVRPYAADGSAKALTDGWLKKHRGETILVVGHSNTVPDLLNALTGTRAYGNIDEGDYSRLYKVTVSGKGKAKVRELTSD